MDIPRIESPAAEPRPAFAQWCGRMLHGLRYRWFIDRSDVSPMVASLDNFGEMLAALEACARVAQQTPLNVHAHLHMIDFCARRFRDLRAAARYRDRALAVLEDAGARALVESFYVYSRATNRHRNSCGLHRHPLLSGAA